MAETYCPVSELTQRLPQEFTFHMDGKVVLRITQDAITLDPTVSPDRVAQEFLGHLGVHVKAYRTQALEDAAKLAEKMSFEDPYVNQGSAQRIVAAIRGLK